MFGYLQRRIKFETLYNTKYKSTFLRMFDNYSQPNSTTSGIQTKTNNIIFKLWNNLLIPWFYSKNAEHKNGIMTPNIQTPNILGVLSLVKANTKKGISSPITYRVSLKERHPNFEP